MSKWIDADALIMTLRLEYPMIPMFKENRKEWEIKTEGYRKAEEVIKEAPSIDIVRCKECAKRMREDCPMCNGCKLDRVPTEDNDFCSYGERSSE